MLFDLVSIIKRRRHEPPLIAAVIQNEGVSILEHRCVARLAKTPFAGLRIFPILYEYRVRYENGSGYWYVRTSGDHGPYDWAWVDDTGTLTIPVAGKDACAAADVRPIGWLMDFVIVFGTIAAGLLLCIIVYLMFF